MIGNNDVGGGKTGGNKTNLLNSSSSKKSIKTGYLISKNAKKSGGNSKNGNGNTKKGVKAARSFNYLTLGTPKAFNLSQYAFI